jgi:hypothetical protein
MDQTYSMYIEDYMSPAFTIYDANNDGESNELDVSFTTTGSKEDSVREDWPTNPFDYYEIADETYDKILAIYEKIDAGKKISNKDFEEISDDILSK